METEKKKPARKKSTPKKKEEEFVDVKAKLSDIIDLNPLYRVKGDSRIHFILSSPNKQGMVGMRPWEGGPSKSVHVSNLTSIAQHNIFKEDGTTIPIKDALDNLFERFSDNTVEEGHDLRETACPGYDPDKFHQYHMDRMIKWFNEIVGMVKGSVPSEETV